MDWFFLDAGAKEGVEQGKGKKEMMVDSDQIRKNTAGNERN